jgi:hypothetical protein
MRATFLLVGLVLGCGGNAASDITLYSGQDPEFSAIDTATFNEGPLADNGQYYPSIDEAGMNIRGVHSNPEGQFVFWGYIPPHGDGTPTCYFNGGALDVMGITLLDGSDFETVEFQAATGYKPPTAYLWIQAYLDGSPVASFDFDAQQSQYVGITGGGFDELRIGGYYDTGHRDLHDERVYEALALDNISYGPAGLPGHGCYPDLTEDGALDLFDFLAFVNEFNAGDPSADCDESGTPDLFDFLCFTNAFNAGC